jgi:2,4-dienoyl-CoA reductase-like NADH-dependent reductase (Old Yellow Enzyme family)
MPTLFEPLAFARGPAMKNRFMLAPLTNWQSHPDGRLSDDEFNWLVMRAKGGFGLTMTCAAHVQRQGQGFPGQLGVFSDDHLPGLRRLAAAIKAQGSVSSVQLHHAGIRSPADLIGQTPVGPSDDAETGARALTGGEVEHLTEDFIAAAVRAEKAGFDGVELHGAHGYILCAFISPETNRRTDAWGGSLQNRARIVTDIIKGVRTRTRPDFQLGLRLSPERFGLILAEQRELAAELLASGDLDFLDMSLWDVFKDPVEEAYHGRPLIDWFAELPRGATRLGVAGKLMAGETTAQVLDHGADFAILGRAAILHHDYPRRLAADPAFHPAALPVAREHLRREGLGAAFIDYMNGWKGFVAAEQEEEEAVDA